MESDSLPSPLSSESQDGWGSGLWMNAENDFSEERGREGPPGPRAQREDTHPASPEQQPSPSGDGGEDFCSSRLTGNAVMASNCVRTPTTDQEWPPVPVQAVQLIMDQHCESPEGSDSIIFLSEDSEEQGIDCKPLDFTSAREQWVRRDSSFSKPPTPASSRALVTEPQPPRTDPGEFHSQQGEPDAPSPAPDDENQEVQQVSQLAPPLETVTSEQTANPGPESTTCSAIVVKESLIEAGGWREGRRESEQTDRERKQTASGSGTVESRRESETEDLGRETNELMSADAQGSERAERMDVDPFEDSQSDSGVSADFSPNSTAEISSASGISSSPDPNETPIEKEIRLAIRREQSLRRARGLNAEEDKTKEFVEIPVRKSILSQELPLKSLGEGKDRQFAGKKMQKEIRAEVEREKVLVQLGRLPGFYDKGTVRQLREKKLLFEAFQEPKELPTVQNKAPSSVSSCEISNGGTVEAISKERVRSLEILGQNQNINQTAVDGFTVTSARLHGPGLTEGTKGQVIILENTPLPRTSVQDKLTKSAAGADGSGRSISVKAYGAGRVRNQDEDDGGSELDEESAMVKENPFFKLRSSLSLRPDVQQDIREAREREKELRKQRTSLYGHGSEVEGARSPTNTPSRCSNWTTLEQPAERSSTPTSGMSAAVIGVSQALY